MFDLHQGIDELNKLIDYLTAFCSNEDDNV